MRSSALSAARKRTTTQAVVDPGALRAQPILPYRRQVAKRAVSFVGMRRSHQRRRPPARSPGWTGLATLGILLAGLVCFGFGLVDSVLAAGGRILFDSADVTIAGPDAMASDAAVLGVAALEPSGPRRSKPIADLEGLADRAAVKVISRSCRGRTSGTGVLVAAQGTTMLVTNHHVVSGGGEVSVHVDDSGSAELMVVVASDPGADLAVAVPLATVVDSSTVGGWAGDAAVLPLVETFPPRGERLVVAGFPLGREVAIVEASAQLSVTGSAYGFEGDVVLVNGAAAPGMSGGPVIADDGGLVAIVAAVDETTGLVVGVPASEIRQMVEQVDLAEQPDINVESCT